MRLPADAIAVHSGEQFANPIGLPVRRLDVTVDLTVEYE
jgi:hypothetical protein